MQANSTSSASINKVAPSTAPPLPRSKAPYAVRPNLYKAAQGSNGKGSQNTGDADGPGFRTPAQGEARES